MKIKNVTDTKIEFDNGNCITYDHEQDCCEYNWADFTSLTDKHVNYNADFKEDLIFEFINGMGFRFGSRDENDDLRWIFIPCYSCQNGYYSTGIDIYYNGKKVLIGYCEGHSDC